MYSIHDIFMSQSICRLMFYIALRGGWFNPEVTRFRSSCSSILSRNRSCLERNSAFESTAFLVDRAKARSLNHRASMVKVEGVDAESDVNGNNGSRQRESRGTILEKEDNLIYETFIKRNFAIRQIWLALKFAQAYTGAFCAAHTMCFCLRLPLSILKTGRIHLVKL